MPLKIRKAELLLFVLALGIFAYLSWGLLHPAYLFKDLTFRAPSNVKGKVHVPIITESDRGKRFLVEGSIIFEPNREHRLWLIPDDCLLAVILNGKKISLADYSREELCNWRNGVNLDLDDALETGENNFRFIVENSAGGRHSLRVVERYRQPWQSLLLVSGATLLGISLVWLSRWLGLSRIGLALVILGVLLRVLYFSYTDFSERMHDVLDAGGHLDFVRVVAGTGELPNRDAGWEFHQQPLYYVLAGGLYALVSDLGASNENAAVFILQIFSLLCSVGFLLVGVATIERMLRASFFRHSALLFFVCFPGGVIHSSRLGNDCLLYLFVSLSLYCLLIYYKDESRSNLAWAGVWAGLSVLTKLSGLMSILVLVGLLLLKLVFSENRFAVLKDSVVLAAIVGISLLLTFWLSAAVSLVADDHDWMMGTSTHQLNPNLMLGNDWLNYIHFDSKVFFDVPYMNPWIDESGRQYFWNYVLKTALVGEWHYPGEWSEVVAGMLSVALVLLLLFVGMSYLQANREDVQKALPVLVCTLLPIFVLMLFRFKVPAAPSSDFRFILPVLIYFSALSCGQFDRLWQRGSLIVPVVGTFLVCALAIASILFFVVLQPVA